MSREFTAENWFTASENKVRFSRMRAPYDNIYIGCDPLDGMTKELADSFDAIVNVSCSPCAYFNPSRPDQRMHWTPINEMGYWGYAAFYYIAKVLDYHFEKGHKVYLHCHAGAYRSPTMAKFWLVSRGHTMDEAISIELNNPKSEKRWKEGNTWEHTKKYPFESLNVPHNIEEFFNRMRKQPATYGFASLLFHPPIDTTMEVTGRYWKEYRWKKWFWFYYEPKYWVWRRWSYYKYYIEGMKVLPFKPIPEGETIFSISGWDVKDREGKFAELSRKFFGKYRQIKYTTKWLYKNGIASFKKCG